MKPIEMGKEYQTRDGRKVRVLAVDLKNNTAYSVVAALTDHAGTERVSVFTKDGQRFMGQHDTNDLIETPKPFRIERWVNVFRCEVGSGLMTESGLFTKTHYSPEDATLQAYNRIACVRVIIEGHEGDGL